jgi:hypothetical protein
MIARQPSLACLACLISLALSTAAGAEEEKKAAQPTKAKTTGTKKKARRPAPKLVIAARETILEREGKPAERFASFAELARAHPGLKGQFAVSEAQPETEARERVTTVPREDRKGIKVHIEMGDIPVLEMVRFLADYTGLPVIVEAANPAALDRTITLPAPVAEADDALVLAMLRTNGFLVHEENIAGSGRALLVEPLDGPPPASEPTPRPIVIAGGEEERRAIPRAGGGPRYRIAKGPAGEEAVHQGVVFTSIPEIVAAQVMLEDGKGVLVAGVDEKVRKKDPFLSLLKRYDILTHVNETAIGTPEDAVKVLATAGDGDLRVLRKGTFRILRRSRP